MSAGVATGLATVPGVTTVRRLAGADRYLTAAAINQDAFTTAATTYLANGTNFPDALVGSALAGWKDSPLYLSPQACLSPAASAGLDRHGSTNLTLLGDVNALSANVANLQLCS